MTGPSTPVGDVVTQPNEDDDFLGACIRCDEPMASDELFCQTCVVWSQDVELAEAPDA